MVFSRYKRGGAIGRAGVLALVAIAAMLLGSCREEEQDRPLRYEEGVYQGPADEALSEAERRALQDRGLQQKF